MSLFLILPCFKNIKIILAFLAHKLCKTRVWACLLISALDQSCPIETEQATFARNGSNSNFLAVTLEKVKTKKKVKLILSFPDGSVDKESHYNAGNARDMGLIPGKIL